MNFLLPTISVLALGASAFAQTPSATVPSGFLTTEGDTYHWVPGRHPDAKGLTTYNASVVGLPNTIISSLALRADGTFSSAFESHTLDFTIHMSSVGVPLPAAVNTGSFSANYGTDRTMVMNNMAINFPAYQNPSPTPLWIWLPISSFPYLAGNNLQVEYDVSNSSGVVGPWLWEVDAEGYTTTGYESNVGTVFGVKCRASGETSDMDLAGTFYNHGTKFRIRYSVTDAPPSTLVYLAMDLLRVDLPLPGLCTNIYSLGQVANAPIAASLATGSTGNVYLDPVAHIPAIIGLTLTNQAYALDFGQAGLPIVLTNGLDMVIPSDPGPLGAKHQYWYATTGNPTVSDVPAFNSNLGPILGIN